MQKKTTLAIFTIIILGIFNEIFPVFFESNLIYYLKELFTFFDLEIGHSHFFYNPINVSFYVLLFIAIVIYLINSKEIRLLRFLIAVMFLSNVFNLAGLFITGWGFYKLILIGWKCFILFTLYKILSFLRKDKVIETMIREYGDPNEIIIVESTLLKRFFNHVIDTVIIILFFSSLMFGGTRFVKVVSILESVETTFGEKLGVWVIIAVISVAYYFISEYVLQASPAKFLSETRVIDESGNGPKGNNILTRTFSRLVPFEAFSFFTGSGWHDRWSGTFVAKEKNEGIRPGWYFFFIPLVVIVVLFFYSLDDKIQGYKMEKQRESDYNTHIEELGDKLDKLSLKNIIILKQSGFSNYDERFVYIKPEKITDDEVRFVRIMPLQTEIEGYGGKKQVIYKTSPRDIEKAYHLQKDTLKLYTINKGNLKKGVLSFEEHPDHRMYGSPLFGMDVFNDGTVYYIQGIDDYFSLNLILDSEPYYYENGKKILRLINNGWSANIVSITDNDTRKKSVWSTEKESLYQGEYLFLQSTDADSSEDVDINIVLKDTLNDTHAFRLYLKGGLFSKQELYIEKIK